ncbi:Unknown protein sequence [Pseudomonas amygdali pv. lachrymans]|nr:Unknown protein sequence [Pseudomonas amygdali pv. lachrymans]
MTLIREAGRYVRFIADEGNTAALDSIISVIDTSHWQKR